MLIFVKLNCFNRTLFWFKNLVTLSRKQSLTHLWSNFTLPLRRLLFKIPSKISNSLSFDFSRITFKTRKKTPFLIKTPHSCQIRDFVILSYSVYSNRHCSPHFRFISINYTFFQHTSISVMQPLTATSAVSSQFIFFQNSSYLKTFSANSKTNSHNLLPFHSTNYLSSHHKWQISKNTSFFMKCNFPIGILFFFANYTKTLNSFQIFLVY